MELETMIKLLLIIIVLIGLCNLILNIYILNKVRFNEFRMNHQISRSVQSEGVVFCKKCNCRYSVTMTKCPACGEVRK